jgi:hypothetical protein
MRLPKQSRPAVRNPYTATGTGRGPGRGVTSQGLLPPFVCHALCAAGFAACMAAGGGPLCAVAKAACDAAC